MGKSTSPGKGDTNSIQTGDSTNIALLFAAILAAGAVLAGTAFYKRKEKTQKTQ